MEGSGITQLQWDMWTKITDRLLKIQAEKMIVRIPEKLDAEESRQSNGEAGRMDETVLKGQMTVFDYPELLPEENLIDTEELMELILSTDKKVGTLGRIKGFLACNVTEDEKIEFIKNELPDIGCSYKAVLEIFPRLFQKGWIHGKT